MKNNQGNNYEWTKNLDIVEIAKLVRKDIKKAYPTIKASVRVDKYSMGCSLNVELSNFGNLVADAVEGKVKEMIASYNYDNSDVMIDYFDVKFSSFVSVNYN